MAKYYYHSWTADEDHTLSEIMEKGAADRRKAFELLEEASVKLDRTIKSCENRWYKLNKESRAV